MQSVFSLFLAKSIWENKVFESLIPNIWVFLAHILASIILIAFIIYFAWKPTKEFMKKRKEAIQKEIEEAKLNNLQSKKELKEAKEFVEKTNSEFNAMKKDAEQESQEIRKNIIETANQDAQAILEKANYDIKKQEKQMRSNINDEISEAAITVAEELVKTKIDKKTNSKLIDSIIEDLKN